MFPRVAAPPDRDLDSHAAPMFRPCGIVVLSEVRYRAAVAGHLRTL